MSELSPVYQGQFGEFSITSEDRREVLIYRSSLMIAALSFLLSSCLVAFFDKTSLILNLLTVFYALFSLSLGISLSTIHIYLRPLHLLLKLFWVIGTVSSLILIINHSDKPIIWIYQHPLSLLGVGFIFAALTGIYFKEAFCFNRLETKFLTPIVPFLLLGHLLGLLSVQTEKILLLIWSILFLIFAIRKAFQSIPDDIGDKSVFEYLKQQRSPINNKT